MCSEALPQVVVRWTLTSGGPVSCGILRIVIKHQRGSALWGCSNPACFCGVGAAWALQCTVHPFLKALNRVLRIFMRHMTVSVLLVSELRSTFDATIARHHSRERVIKCNRAASRPCTGVQACDAVNAISGCLFHEAYVQAAIS